MGEREETTRRGERRGQRRWGSGEQRLDPRALDGLPPSVVDRLVVRGKSEVARGPWDEITDPSATCRLGPGWAPCRR